MKEKKQCEAGTPLCSGQLIVAYGVNGSARQGKLFQICGACMVYLKRAGHKLKQSKERA